MKLNNEEETESQVSKTLLVRRTFTLVNVEVLKVSKVEN